MVQLIYIHIQNIIYENQEISKMVQIKFKLHIIKKIIIVTSNFIIFIIFNLYLYWLIIFLNLFRYFYYFIDFFI